MPADGVIHAISLTRKAGRLVLGFDPVKDNILNGNACLVLTAGDLSPRTLGRVRQLCGDEVELIPLPCTQAELADVTRKPVGVLAVLDPNLARLCKNSIEKYAAQNAAPQ